MKLSTFEFLTWLSVGRPLAYARLLPNLGMNSDRPDSEILAAAKDAASAYPPGAYEPADQSAITSNIRRAQGDLPPVSAYYPTYTYVTTPDGVTKIVKLLYGTTTGEPPLIDLAPLIPNMNAYADYIKAAHVDAAWVAKLSADSESIQNKEIADAAEAARVQAIKAAESLKAAQDASAIAVSRKTAEDAAIAQAAADNAALVAKHDTDQANFLAAEAQRAIDSAARVNQVVKNANDAIYANEQAAIAAKATSDAQNAAQVAKDSQQVADAAKLVATAVTQSTNQTLVNNNLTPGELVGNSHTLLYLSLAAAAFLLLRR